MKSNSKTLIAFLMVVLVTLACSSPITLNLSSGSPAAQSSNTNQAPNSISNDIDPTVEPVIVNQTEALQAYQARLEAIYQQVNPSVVNVEVASSSASSFGNLPTSDALGSGFIWNTGGYIVTNNHVIEGAQRITVTFADGTIAAAEVVGTDPRSDLAVIKVEVDSALLHPMQLTDSSQVRVGQLAIAIGNPYGLSGTMTVGIISGLSRSLAVDMQAPTSMSGARYSIPDIIQTDAPINPGNSGGVLVDDQGRLIGVTAAIQSTTGANAGIGFVIPANIVQRIIPFLIDKGEYHHSWLGISGTSLTPDLAKEAGIAEAQRGALVLEVVENSPAMKAGLQGGQSGDVITAIDGQTVQRFDDMISYLYNHTSPGQKVMLTILREGREVEVPLTLGVLPVNP